ncbi:MAG: penicillin-binding protein activator [Pseudomonadota bacterium]|nr:penicillin-binding protein activator [Pseudomonadota bacterium]
MGVLRWRSSAKRGRPGIILRGLAVAVLGALALTACRSSDLGVDRTAILGGQPSNTSPTPNPNGEVFGTGAVRVSLLLPKSAPGNGAAVAQELRNGALLALQDFGQDTIQIVIKDTSGQAASAQAAANEAILEGSSAILGPVFSASVSAASAIALPAGRTMIAFSTDTSVARRGVYLLSFTPQDDTRRIINFALSQGKRAFLAFLPTSSEGTIREGVLRQLLGPTGASLQVIRYERTNESLEQAAIKASPLLESVDSIYIPEGGQIPNAIMQNLRRVEADTVGKVVLGSGLWETVKLDDPMLENAIYPNRDVSNFDSFASRYENAYGAKPGVWAGLGYDSVTLTIELVRQTGNFEGFKQVMLENPRGFTGINGIFRLRADGTAERGLAIYRVLEGRPDLLSPAPKTFSRSAL